jgi:hypothetical protein
MKCFLASVLATVLTLPAVAAPHEGMMRHPMPGMGMMMEQGMGGGEHLCHIVGSGHHNDGTLAFLKAELNITAAQQSAWDAFATAYRGGDHAMHDEGDDASADEHKGGGMGKHDMQPLPERMEMHEHMMEARLGEMKRMHAAVAVLYAALNGEQKSLADELVPAFMMCRMHM